MDFGFTEEQQILRKECHNFFINELPADFQGSHELHPISEELQSLYKEWQRKLVERGWLTPGWPKEYGGTGLSEIERGIINEEEGYWRIQWPSIAGVHLVGPTLLLFGTEEQKKRFLPSIAQGKVVCLEAFTEPDAGSDEANVKLRALQNGDEFIINGQKTFITGTYEPDYLYTLARTSDTTPKHRGLSLFLIPADIPGITYRALPCMGGYMTNEIFFDDVRVGKEYLLGELNRGFYYAMATLEFERTGTGFPAAAKRNLEEFVQFCKETKLNGKVLMEDPQVRDALALIAVEVEVFRLASWRTVWKFSQREKLGPLGYDLSGFWWKTFGPSHCETMMNIMGLDGQIQAGSKWAKLAGSVERRWQQTRSMHAGGTIEIYKIVLAERGLGLPRRR
jgi:hypothetical protein